MYDEDLIEDSLAFCKEIKSFFDDQTESQSRPTLATEEMAGGDSLQSHQKENHAISHQPIQSTAKETRRQILPNRRAVSNADTSVKQETETGRRENDKHGKTPETTAQKSGNSVADEAISKLRAAREAKAAAASAIKTAQKPRGVQQPVSAQQARAAQNPRGVQQSVSPQGVRPQSGSASAQKPRGAQQSVSSQQARPAQNQRGAQQPVSSQQARPAQNQRGAQQPVSSPQTRPVQNPRGAQQPVSSQQARPVQNPRGAQQLASAQQARPAQNPRGLQQPVSAQGVRPKSVSVQAQDQRYVQQQRKPTQEDVMSQEAQSFSKVKNVRDTIANKVNPEGKVSNAAEAEEIRELPEDGAHTYEITIKFDIANVKKFFRRLKEKVTPEERTLEDVNAAIEENRQRKAEDGILADSAEEIEESGKVSLSHRGEQLKQTANQFLNHLSNRRNIKDQEAMTGEEAASSERELKDGLLGDKLALHKTTATKWVNNLIIFIFCVGIAYFSASLVTNFIAHQTTVEGESMEPTLSNGDSVIIQKLSYYFRAPERYDVVVFPVSYGKMVENEDTYYIKRVIGLPGETVQIIDGCVFIDGEQLQDDKYALSDILDPGVAAEPLVLMDNEYFVMGDNRNMSTDSRSSYVGLVNRADIVGEAWFCTWPLNHFGSLTR